MSTPRDMVAILERLENGDLGGSKEMLAILKRQQDNTGMRRYLSGDPGRQQDRRARRTARGCRNRLFQGRPHRHGDHVDGIPKPDYGPDNQGSLIISDLSKLIVERLATPAKE